MFFSSQVISKSTSKLLRGDLVEGFFRASFHPFEWFCIITQHDWLKTLAPLFDPIRIQDKTSPIHPQTFSRAFCRQHVFAGFLIGSLDCLYTL